MYRKYNDLCGDCSGVYKLNVRGGSRWIATEIIWCNYCKRYDQRTLKARDMCAICKYKMFYQAVKHHLP